MRLLSVCLCLVVAVLLPACEPRVCCALPPPAVLVSVVDSEDRLVRDAVVTYVDETPPRQPSGEPPPPTAPPAEEKAWCRTGAKKDAGCEVWAVGTFDGVFRLRATSADGTRRVEEVVSVETPTSFNEDNIAKRRLVLPD